MGALTTEQKIRHAEYMRQYRLDNRDLFRARDRERYVREGWRQRAVQRTKRTGWTQELVDEALKAQGGKCALCTVPLVSGRGPTSIAADHDHKTGKRRGILCSRCNALEGIHLKLSVDEEEWARRVKIYRAKDWR